MSIAPDELICFASACRPEDDLLTAGGSIDESTRVTFDQLVSPTTIKCSSSSGADTTQTVVVAGKTQAGIFQYETQPLNGTNTVSFSTIWGSLAYCKLNKVAVGTVTIRRANNTLIQQIPPGEKGFTALFVRAQAISGANTPRYEKTFWKNTNGITSLTSAICQLFSDPNLVIRQGIAPSLQDVYSTPNRFYPPAGVTFVSLNVNQSVPGGDLPAGSSIGVWWALMSTTDAGATAYFDAKISGDST